MTQPLVDLTDRVVLITGAGQGLGAAHARVLADHGARVVVTDLTAGPAEAVAAEITAGGGDALGLALDVTDRAAWAAVVDRVGERHGRIDGLVNNAGAFLRAPFLETDERLLDLHLRVNLLGPMLGMQAVVPLMRDAGGAVVNIASVAALAGYPQASAYSASKWALRGLSRTAALELGEHGIRVNCICPGAMDTQMISEEARDGRGVVAGLPIARAGRPEEASALVAFLLSSASSYCTGQEFVIDGGMKA
ncbi:SDR family NAD(P)-dependent oxidoreductase [Nocardioides sp. W7]|uniref:SDR family NAD(P)-dependent oxidoreductase n=1 Tax=Nocardioides sp. W7 TaxID=2931390 RepID=UPI001FD03B15|nr:SDR family NAD(P)-dependent oxidoreductase [Nocardioides sp. W7]